MPGRHRMHRFPHLCTDCGDAHCERSRTHHGNIGHGYDGLSNHRGIQQHGSASSIETERSHREAPFHSPLPHTDGI